MYGSAGFVGSAFFAVAQVRLLGRAEQRQVGPQHDHLRAAALGGDAKVEARVASCRRMRLGEERIAPVGTGGGKISTSDDRTARESGLGPPHRGRGGDDLRANLLAVALACRTAASRAVS